MSVKDEVLITAVKALANQAEANARQTEKALEVAKSAQDAAREANESLQVLINELRSY